MKVLLINPMLLARNRRDLEYPLNLAYLSAGLKESAPDVSSTLLDMTFEYFSQRLEAMPAVRAQELCVERAWKERGPFDLVGIGGVCDNFHLSVRLAEFVKKKFHVPVVIGGPHSTFVAEDVLRAFSFVDFVIRNDGIYPLIKLCEFLKEGAFEKVPALVYRDPSGGGILQNQRATVGPDVMSVAPDYSYPPLEEYVKLNPTCLITVLAGTGCPFQCTYCSTSLMWDRRYRVLPPKVIAARMRELKKKFPDKRYSLIHDDLLCDKGFTLKLCSELKDLGVAWGGSSRLDHVAGNRALIRKLKASGCHGLFIGIETGSAAMQKVIGKRIDVSKVVPLAKDLVEEGLNPVFSFILGFPEETDEDRDKTVRLAFSLRVLQAERVNILHLFPLPGTAVAGKPPFFPEKDTVYRPPQISADAITKKLVSANPYIFRHFWSLPDGPGQTKLLPSATWELHDYGVDHYRSFNYLFSHAGVRPSALFHILGDKKTDRDVFRVIRGIVGREPYRVFSEMFRYENLLNRMIGTRESRPRAASLEFSAERRYSLSGNIALFRSSVRLPDYLGTELPPGVPGPAERPTFLCLVDSGGDVETFEIQEKLFSVLQAMRGASGLSLGALVSSVRGKQDRSMVSGSLKKLVKMGALKYA
jgi:hypothetical protein